MGHKGGYSLQFEHDGFCGRDIVEDNARETDVVSPSKKM